MLAEGTEGQSGPRRPIEVDSQQENNARGRSELQSEGQPVAQLQGNSANLSELGAPTDSAS